MMKSDIIDFKLLFIKETDKAIGVKETEDDDVIWLPKSQIEFEIEPGGYVTVSMPEWLAKEKELI